MIEVTTTSDGIVTINLRHVTYFEPGGGERHYTHVALSDGTDLYIAMEYRLFAAKVNSEYRDWTK